MILPMLFLLIKLLASLHFYKPQSLQRHIKIHTEEKNICCEFCDMKFWMMNEYKKHLVKHTGELLYSHKTVEAPFFLVLPDSGPCNIIYMYSYVTVKVHRIRSTFHIKLRTDQSV